MNKRTIKYLSFDYINTELREELIASFTKGLDSQWYILGSQVTQFEEEWAAWNQSKYAIGVASGLDAIIIALRCLDIGSGDEVIVPSNTYIASVMAVTMVGATPIFVEPNPDTFNIDPNKIEAKITAKTKAIIPVHLYGQISEMEAIMTIAEKHNLFVVEDNAQSQGSLCNGKIAGSFGHMNATSFYPGKNIGALGDGGAITTNDEALYHKARMYRNYGSEKKYHNTVIGYNSRLDEIQAGLLSVKMKKLDTWNIQRQEVAQWYDQALANINEIQSPRIAPNIQSVYHIYPVQVKQREALQSFLKSNGVHTLIHYPIPTHLSEAYQYLGYQSGDFPIAEQIAKQELSLPIYPGLTQEDIHYIADLIRQFYSK